MNKQVYSNIEFTKLKERINNEILRRGTFKWWDPLTNPAVGKDRSSPLSIPDVGDRILVDSKTYTINNPSEGSLERTRNIYYPAHGENPGGKEPDPIGPDTSAGQLNFDEARNFLIGLAKINDVNIFYGREEVRYLAFRDANYIEDAVKAAEASKLNRPVGLSDISPSKIDPLSCDEIAYEEENDLYVMPSGEYDGEETTTYEPGLGINNFYDDYGAKPGDSNFHTYNRFNSEHVTRHWNDQDNQRNTVLTRRYEGGKSSTRFGKTPRNPNKGDRYRPRPAYGGVKGACQGACTGLCYLTCDNECSESCTTTCWSRCGEACTSTCGNVCTGCSTMCYTSCKTKCENTTGYSCVKAGAKTVEMIATTGNGVAQNRYTFTTFTCTGCQYSCQFYPNKKTECWDSGCMGMCFISCNTACSTSCYGGCVDNDAAEGTDYKSGKGKGCSSGCTINCNGLCYGVCEGYCTQTCFHACMMTCSDNCSWTCMTKCGNGCANGCSLACTGCRGECVGIAGKKSCTGCGYEGGCSMICQHDCNSNCVGIGCRSICGIDNEGACEANCRINCMNTSCTAMCEDACSSQCTTCVNTCGWQCGTCSSLCAVGCESVCNMTCTQNCEHSCNLNCVTSCTEECGGCSTLCYSCVGMCIGVCSVKCTDTCTNCTNQCGYWCDNVCNQACFANCEDSCISNCYGSCATLLQSDPKTTPGPERDPTADGYIYPHPQNRWEERESFKLTRYIRPWHPTKGYLDDGDPDGDIDNPDCQAIITTNDDNDLIVGVKYPKVRDDNGNIISGGVYEFISDGKIKYATYETTPEGGVFTIDQKTAEISVNVDMLPGEVSENKPNIDGKSSVFIVIFYYNPEFPLKDENITVKLPFGFEFIPPMHDEDNNTIVVIQRDEFLFPEEEEE